MLGNLRMCQEVFAFWEIEVRRIDTWELVFRKENYFLWLRLFTTPTDKS